MSLRLYIYFGAIFLLLSSCSSTKNATNAALAIPGNWEKKELLFEDEGTTDWTQKWFLDGKRARINNLPSGMYFAAGPEAKNDTCHAVLWTQRSFAGNIAIEFDYTRVDTTGKFVNILYFHATGKGTDGVDKDIRQWNEKREVPSMRIYFRNMNTYHISFATSESSNDYVRLRRYNPSVRIKLAGSEILPDNFNTGLFKPFSTYHIQVLRQENEISMSVQNKSDAEDKFVFRWDASSAPICSEGRIGLRHMYTRASIYKDFRVWRLEEK